MTQSARQMLAGLPVYMANGGSVSDEDIRNWFASNVGASDAQIRQAMDQYGVSTTQLASAMGYDPGEVQQRYDAQAWQPGPSLGRQNAAQTGGEAEYLANVANVANQWLANPGTAAEAYDAMIRSGIDVRDLLDAGISQDVINQALTVTTPEQQKLVNQQALGMYTSMLTQNPGSGLSDQGAEAIYRQAQQYVQQMQQDGITPEELNTLRQVATAQGWGFADIRAAGLDPMLLFGEVAPPPLPPALPPPPPFDDTAAREAERQRLAAEEAERQRLAGLAAEEAERQRLAAAAAEAERRRLADAQVVAPGVTTGDMVKAVTPTYSADDLRNIIKVAEQQPPPLGTITNPMDTRGSAETGSQSGVSQFLETYTAPTPFTPPPYTPPTVYDPEAFARENAGADLYAKGETALDTEFRESAPRQVSPVTGQYTYTPAASLRPATGAGWSWTPPVVTSRPRQLLDVGPTASASQLYAQSRQQQDSALRNAFASANLPMTGANTYYWQSRLRGGDYSPSGTFDQNRFMQDFQSWAASQGSGTSGMAGQSQMSNAIAQNQLMYDDFGNPYQMPMMQGAGALAPKMFLNMQPQFFADGGEASARELLDRLKKPDRNKEAQAQLLADQMLAIGNQPSSPMPSAPHPQTESASMLQNIAAGTTQIPGTVYDYGRRVFESDRPLATFGGDVMTMGGAMYEGLKEDPVGFTLDIAPIIGEIRSAMDARKLSNLANEAEAAGDTEAANNYRQLAAVAAAGAAPLAGTGVRVGKRIARSGITDVPPDSARGMLNALTPEAGAVPEEGALTPAVTGPVEPSASWPGASRMLEELDSIQPPPSELPVRPIITEEIGDRRRVGTTGRYVGAPEDINTPQKLAALTRSITNLTKEGEFGRFWYERSGRQILDITGGDVADADRLAQAIAITSARTPVGTNFDYALQAYYQWKNGQPIRTGMYTDDMSDKLQRMFDGEEWAGRKTNNFYNNLMREIDPSRAQGVTADIWMMRAFGFDKDAPTPAQYSFVENETKRIAQKLGWEPQQVQAAIWVALKSRMENPDVKKAVEAKSFENGWITYNDKGERVILDANKHAANWLESAMQHTPTAADRAAAKFDYADAAANNLAQISWESIPSRTSRHLPEIFDAPPNVVQDYHVQMSKAFLDDAGNDIIAKELGILSPGDFEAPGYFEQRVSPGTQTNITAPRQYGITRRVAEIKEQAAAEGWPKDKLDAAIRAATYATEPSAKEAMSAYAAARGILLKQDGVGMHRPAFITDLSRPKANGVEVSIGRPLTARETAEIARLVAAEAGHTEYNPIASPNGVRFINFDYLETPNTDFQKVVNNALKKMEFDNGEAVNGKMFGADTGYLGNNWTENLNGEGYLDAGDLAGRPDLQRKVRDLVTRLAPRVSAVEDEFANRYNWTRNRQLNSAYEAQQGVVPASGSLPQAAENVAAPAASPVRPFKRGGTVERVTNDNRKYL